MRNKKSALVILSIYCALLCFPLVANAKDMYVSASTYDYAPLAKKITVNASTKKQKARAIYNWVCSNIAYDTNYKIYTADECIRNRKGVCQAYCELYYRLCEAVGVKCTIISGKCKNNIYGIISDGGHAWICAEVEEGNILIDPTWGAGSLKGRTFSFRKDHSVYFQVDPYKFIFTHFPNDKKFQLLDNPIDYNTFASLPPMPIECLYLNLNAKDIFFKSLKKEIKSFPLFYSIEKEQALQLIKFPMQEVLNPATTYRFEVKNPNNIKFSIFVNGKCFDDYLWQKSGNTYWIDIMSEGGDELSISTKYKGENSYSTLVSYQVSQPTQSEIQYINTHKSPTYYRAYEEFGKLINIINIPKYDNLKASETYRFEIDNPRHLQIAIIVNNTWYKSSTWQRSGSRYWIDIKPSEKGELRLSIQKEKNKPFNSIIGYTIK